MTGHALVARLDNAGDVLLAGPAVRAVAAGADRVTMLCGPSGAAAARLLPGVDDVVVFDAPWVSFSPPATDRAAVEHLVDRLARAAIDDAVVITSFHQSPLPLALLLRLAGVGRIAAICDDYPGSLLDVRHRLPDTGLHEVERALSLAATLGYHLPAGDAGGLALRGVAPSAPVAGRFVVIHPGASVPARGVPLAVAAEAAAALTRRGTAVVVTGGAAEREATAAIAAAAPGALDLGGQTHLAQLAAVIAAADVIVTGNTGPAHLAAAVGTPVVSVFAPVVPAERWRPWRVPTVLLGDQGVECAGCRARACPLETQACLLPVTPSAVVDAVEHLAAGREAPPVPASAGGGVTEGLSTRSREPGLETVR